MKQRCTAPSCRLKMRRRKVPSLNSTSLPLSTFTICNCIVSVCGSCRHHTNRESISLITISLCVSCQVAYEQAAQVFHLPTSPAISTDLSCGYCNMRSFIFSIFFLYFFYIVGWRGNRL